MSYLLDTNACIAIINGSPQRVRLRLEQAVKRGDDIAVPAVAAFEHDDARAAGEIRAALEACGTPIGAYDLLIAGQAMRHRAILVTANTSELARVDGLRWEDWASPG